MSNIRNIGIIAHIDAGKTTTTERILYYTGQTYNIGEVHDGNTVTDHMAQERERGITIQSAAITTNWKFNNEKFKINIIDTPGHIDFGAEVERSLRVLDGAVIVFCSVGAVQPQTETVWRQCNKYNVPRMAFVNKMDRLGANFFNVLNQIEQKLKIKPFPITIPIGAESDFIGIVDLIRMKAIVWENDLPDSKYDVIDIPDNYIEIANIWRHKLIEVITEFDDKLLDKYINGEEFEIDEIISSIRESTLKLNIIPITCGSAFKNKGIQQLLNNVVEFLPNPLEKGVIHGIDVNTELDIIRQPVLNEKLSGLIFKVVTDKYVGKLIFIRIYSGILKSGQYVYNSGKKKNERISRLYEISADKKLQIDSIDAGNIIAVVGLSNIHTGDTISDTEFPIILESITFSEPVISISIEPKSNKDLDRLSISLSKLTEEDPTFKVKTDSITGQIILSGMGELHLEIIIDRLLRDFNVECNQGIPKVNYKETITTSVEHHEILKKQTGGHGMFAEIKFRIEPSDSEGLIFINEIKGGNIPKEFINAIEKGIKDSLSNGCLAGFEIYGIKYTIFDGSYHIVDSNTTSFEICAREGLKKALLKSNPVLMEPIMDEEIETPEDYMGDIISDLHKRRSRIVKIDDKFGIKIISAKSPLANKFGYITTLRNISSGHATSNLTFSHYEKLSESLTNEIVNSIK